MKHSILLCAIISLFVIAGCTEEELPYRPPEPGTPEVPPVAIDVDAGGDQLVELPKNEVTLMGSTSEWDYNIKEHYWTKISGPDGFGIINKDALETRLFDLEKGFYQLELTVLGISGQSAKDTMTVTVGELSPNPKELLLKDQPWIIDYDLTIFLFENVYTQILRGSFFKVYVRKDSTAAWEEAKHYDGTSFTDSFVFGIHDDNMWLAASPPYTFDKSVLKILYD